MTATKEFILTGVPLLAGLSDEEAELLSQAAERRRYERGHTILLKGTTVDGLHVVVSGSVSVWKKEKGQSSAVQVGALGPGEVFGEMSILEPGMAGATVKADDDTLIVVLPQDEVRGLLSRRPELEERARILISRRRAAVPS